MVTPWPTDISRAINTNRITGGWTTIRVSSGSVICEAAQNAMPGGRLIIDPAPAGTGAAAGAASAVTSRPVPPAGPS